MTTDWDLLRQNEKLDPDKMDKFEKAAIIGYYRNGVSYEMIGFLIGISESYVQQIVRAYLNKLPSNSTQ